MKKHLFHLFLCFSILLAEQLSAQEEFIEPPARMLTRVSFIQLTGGIVILQARLGDFPDTLNFVLDTGSSGISLDSTTADYFKLTPTPSDKTIRGIAGIRKVSFLYNYKLKFPGLTVDSLDFHINDYTILTEVYGERIDGIIGFALLKRYIIKIDYDNLKLEFWTPGTIRYPRGGYLLQPSINLLASLESRVKDEKAINSRFLYDMGAGVCLLLTQDFVRDSVFIGKKRKRFIKEGEGLGGKIDMEMTVIREFKMGPFRFRNVPIYIFDDEFNVTSYPYLGGLIGNDILRRFNVILNYAKKDFYITPNSHFGDGFDYSYPGIELYMVDGKIIVGDVAKGSSAESVGIKEGDEVLGINKNFTQNLNQYKIALQVPGDKIKLIIRRGGELLSYEFRVKSIY